jgi:hypothetical protein
MSMRITIAAGALAVACTASAVGSQGYLYIQTNDWHAGRNAMRGYAISGGGHLTPVPAAGVRTGGTGGWNQTAGKIGPNDADASVVSTPSGRYVYAVNAGSDSVAAFRVLPGGGLRALPGSPYPSRGVNPTSLSVTRDGTRLIVVNRNEDPLRLAQLRGAARATIATFRIQGNGALRVTGGAPHTGPGAPEQALQMPFAPSVVLSTGLTFELGAGPNGVLWRNAPLARASVQSFAVRPGGAMAPGPWRQIATSGFGTPADDADTAFLLGMWPSSHRPLVYIGLPDQSQILTARYAAGGRLTWISRDTGTGVELCWIRSSPDGDFLYTLYPDVGSNPQGQQVMPRIGTWDVRGARATHPVEISHADIPVIINPYTSADGFVDSTGEAGARIEASPNGRWVFAQTTRGDQTPANTVRQGNSLYGYRVGANGRLTRVSTLHLETVGVPIDVRPYGMAIVQPGVGGTTGG